MQAYNKHDAAGLLGQYEDQASSANAGMPLITDAAARKSFLDGVAADPALKVDFASDRIIVASSGDLATSRGHYAFTFTDTATKKPKTERGNYLTVYRKAADGSWKAVVALEEGEHEYRFLVDGQWQDDADCPTRRPNGFGQQNCIRTVR